MTRLEKFWARVAVGGPDECWPYALRQRYPNGYGRVYGKPERLAHRVAWELTKGPIPPGLCVCHTCDNRPCCNPAHLWLGTYADNLRDMSKKGRNFRQRATHCPRGHAYEGNNLVVKHGSRECRTCIRAASSRRKKAYWAARRAERASEPK